MVSVCAVHTDTNPGVQWPGLCSDVLCVLMLQQRVAPLPQTAPCAGTRADRRCLGSAPDLGRCDTVLQPQSGQRHALNEVTREAKRFLLEG